MRGWMAWLGVLFLSLFLAIPGFSQEEEADDAAHGAEATVVPEATPSPASQATPEAGGQPTPAAIAPAGSPNKVKVGLSVTDLGKFDLATGFYSADFTISFTSDSPYEAKFQLDNGKVSKIDKVLEEGTKKVYKVKADMNEDIDLSDYPFDSHALSIYVSDENFSNDQVIFEPDQDDIGIEDSVKMAGWEIVGVDSDTDTLKDVTADKSYSQFVYSIQIQRVRLASFMKVMMPVFFMVFVSMLAVLIKAKSVTNRIAMGTAALLSAVMFHVSSTSSLPPLGYLTHMDKFMLATYLVLAMNISFSVLMMVYDDNKNEAKVGSLFNLGKVLLPLLAIAAYAVVLLKLV